MSDQVYSIYDINGYVSQMREAAAKSISEDSINDDLDTYITIDQMMGLVKSNCLGYDENNNPLLNEKSNEKIYEETTVWIHNVGLSKLSAKDLVECAWDDELNEMVFWQKEIANNGKPKRKRKDS
jgi:hypothetical protein